MLSIGILHDVVTRPFLFSQLNWDHRAELHSGAVLDTKRTQKLTQLSDPCSGDSTAGAAQLGRALW